MNESLHDFLGMNRKSSTLKSVFITERVFERCLVLEVDAWGDAGFNALNTTVSRFDQFTDYLNKTIVENYDDLLETVKGAYQEPRDIRVNIYGTYGIEYIITREGKIF